MHRSPRPGARPPSTGIRGRRPRRPPPRPVPPHPPPLPRAARRRTRRRRRRPRRRGRRACRRSRARARWLRLVRRTARRVRRRRSSRARRAVVEGAGPRRRGYSERTETGHRTRCSESHAQQPSCSLCFDRSAGTGDDAAGIVSPPQRSGRHGGRVGQPHVLRRRLDRSHAQTEAYEHRRQYDGELGGNAAAFTPEARRAVTVSPPKTAHA